MRTIHRATPDQANRLFGIMVRATEVGCAPSYPPEVIAIWHKGRSAEGMAGVIAEADVYWLKMPYVPFDAVRDAALMTAVDSVTPIYDQTTLAGMNRTHMAPNITASEQ